MTVEVKCINYMKIRFDLTFPWRWAELQQQVAKRLNLEGGTYRIMYKDGDNDLISIRDDEAIGMCIDTYKWFGSTSIVVLLLPPLMRSQ